MTPSDDRILHAGAHRTIDVRVVPRARHDVVGGDRNGRLLVRTTAPPVDSKANESVRTLLARHFGVAPSAVELLRGATGRDKTFRITGGSDVPGGSGGSTSGSGRHGR